MLIGTILNGAVDDAAALICEDELVDFFRARKSLLLNSPSADCGNGTQYGEKRKVGIGRRRRFANRSGCGYIVAATASTPLNFTIGALPCSAYILRAVRLPAAR